MTEETRQSLEDEYLFTRDYPAIHAALNQRRTLVACIERVTDRYEVCSCAINPDGLIAFTNGYLNLSHAANNEKDFTTACRAMNVAFFQTSVQIMDDLIAGTEFRLVHPRERRAHTALMWIGAITLALLITAALLAALHALSPDGTAPLFR